MTRTYLTAISLFIAFVGLAAVCIPFATSLKPSAKALSDRPHLRFDDIEVGQYALRPVGSTHGFGTSFLIYRPTSSSVRVWRIPTYNGKVILPDLSWWRTGFFCEKFELDPTKKRFHCADEELESYAWGRHEWQWDTEGTNLGKHTEDLPQVKGEISEPFFLVGRN